MLVLNETLFFENEEVLDAYCQYQYDNAETDDNRYFCEVMNDYYYQLFEADKRLTQIVQDKIDEHIIPLVCIEFCNYCDLDKIDFKAVSTQEDFKLLKSQELLFYHYCDVCFGHFKGLLNVLYESYEKK